MPWLVGRRQAVGAVGIERGLPLFKSDRL
jgi:hypothetical protein